MQLYLIVVLLCLRQVAAAQKQSHTEGLVNLSEVTCGERPLWKAADHLALQKTPNNVLHQQTMMSQRLDSATAAWRALGTAGNSFVKVQSFGYSKMKGNVSSLESLPTWRRKLGDRDPPYPANIEVFSEHVDGRAEENKESEANKPSWPSTRTQSTHVDTAGGQEVVEEQKKGSASQDGEKENKTQGADENIGTTVRTEKQVTSDGPRSANWSGQAYSMSTEGRQRRQNHNEANTRGHIIGSAAHTKEATQDVNPSRAETQESTRMNSSAAGAGERFTVVEVQTVFDAEGNREDGEEQCGGCDGIGELRVLGRKRNYVPAFPMKLPSAGPPPPLQPAPKSEEVPPSPPTKIIQSKRPVPLPKKVSTFKRVIVPPTKVHKIHKTPPPLKVVWPKKVVPPPDKYVLPKKVVYPKEKLHPKKMHTKYIPARKKVVPLTKYVPAQAKFAPAPVYVPVPKKL